MPHRCWKGLAVFLVLALCSRAHAGPVYSFSFDQATYVIAPGGMVQVNVSLREDITTGGPSLFAAPGLIGAGVLVTFNDTTVQVANLGAILPNPQFSDDLTSLATTNLTPGVSADLTESVGLGLPVTAAGPGPVYEIRVGTFTFTADPAAPPGHTTSLTASRRALDSQDNVGADGPPPTVLDPVLEEAAASIAVSGSPATVPEPAALVLLAVGGLGLLGYGWHGRR